MIHSQNICNACQVIKHNISVILPPNPGTRTLPIIYFFCSFPNPSPYLPYTLHCLFYCSRTFALFLCLLYMFLTIPHIQLYKTKPNCLPVWIYQFTFLPTVYTSSLWSTFSPYETSKMVFLCVGAEGGSFFSLIYWLSVFISV